MLQEKTYKAGLNKVIECHLVIAGLQELKYNTRGKMDSAIMNNLKQMSIHAGQKRFSQGEIYMPQNLLALCQYEFMLKKMLEYVKSEEIEKGMKIAIRKIQEVRHYYECPAFKEKDEIMIVEVPCDGDNVRAIEPEDLEKWQGEFNRILPIRPEDRQDKFSKNLGGFLNYNGDEKEVVEFVMGKGD